MVPGVLWREIEPDETFADRIAHDAHGFCELDVVSRLNIFIGRDDLNVRREPIPFQDLS